MQDVAMAAAEANEFGAMTSLVQAVGAITSAALAIGLTWRRGGQWVPYQEDLPKAAERVGGVVTSVLISLLWAQYNSHADLPFLNRVAVGGALLALVAFLVYGFLVALQTYQQDVSTATKEKFIKVVGGFWLTSTAQAKVAAGSDVQSLFKAAAYRADKIWTRGGRALAQALFALCFILLTSSGTVALSAAAMVYLIRQSPPPPAPLSGLSLVIPETTSRIFGNSESSSVVGYRVAIDGAIIGEVLASDVGTGGLLVFDAIEGTRTMTVESGAARTWTCPVRLTSASMLYGISSTSENTCSVGAISKQAFEDFTARRKGAADAVLTLTFEGAGEKLVRTGAKQTVRTPDNNENRGGCPREVGREDGRYCISRTPVTLATTTPGFWRNARLSCSGSGCPYSRNGGPDISTDGLTATAYIDNWGSAVDFTLTADEYSSVTPQSCGSDVSKKASTVQAAHFDIPRECVDLAYIRWSLADGRSGRFPVKQGRSSGGEIALDGGLSDQGTKVAFSLKRAL